MKTYGEINKKMCKPSKKLNIGPMPTVVGIITKYEVKAMISDGSENINEITGAAIFLDEKIGLWGNVLQIVSAKVPYELLTRGGG